MSLLESAALPVGCLMGPTASGKTDLALALGRLGVPIEIINVDSVAIYQGLDVGSAKPTKVEQQEVPHHLLDCADPAEIFTVTDFCREAKAAIQRIHAKRKIPLLVGGTPLYFKALLEGLTSLPPGDQGLRKRLMGLFARRRGPLILHQWLKKCDFAAAQRIHQPDRHRIVRALEIYQLTGVPMSLHLKRHRSQEGIFSNYQVVQYLIDPGPMQPLKERISNRFVRLLENGFEAEVQQLQKRGDLSPELPAIRSVGYRQMWSYLKGQSTREEMIQQSIQATWALAKRQMTWFRHWPYPLIALPMHRPLQALKALLPLQTV